MKQKWKDFQESLTDVTAMSKREFLLTIAVCILGGIVFGIFFSPKKSVMIGSNNGNGSGNYGNGEEEETEDWEEFEK